MLVLTLEAFLETLKEKQPKLPNIEQNVISLEKLDKQETIHNMKGPFALQFFGLVLTTVEIYNLKPEQH